MFEEFWNINTVNNTLYYVIAIIVAAILFRKYIGNMIATFFYKASIKTGYNINKEAYFNLLIQPLERFVMWLAIIIALEKIKIPDVLAQTELIAKIKLGQFIEFVLTTVLIVVFCKFILGLVEYIAKLLSIRANKTADQADDQLIIFLKDFLKVIIIIIGVLLVLKFGLKQDIGNLLTGLSIVGAAIALATKESLENLIASFVIFFDKPFVTGDDVKVQNVTGEIEKIGLRSTRIRTGDKTYVTVPNKQMVDSIVDNHSERTKRKATIEIELATNTTVPQLDNFKTQTNLWLTNNKQLLDYKVFFANFTKAGFLYKIEIYTAPDLKYDDFVAVREATNLAIVKLLTENSISIAAQGSN